MTLGIGFGGQEGKWRPEAHLPALLYYLTLQQTWLMGSQGMLLELRNGKAGWVGGRLWRKTIWPTGVGHREEGKATSGGLLQSVDLWEWGLVMEQRGEGWRSAASYPSSLVRVLYLFPAHCWTTLSIQAWFKRNNKYLNWMGRLWQYIFFNTENSECFTKNLLGLVSEFNNNTGYKNNIQKSASQSHWKDMQSPYQT